MSEDEPVEEPVETPVDEAKTTPPGEDGNRAKYRLISGEDILENLSLIHI